MSAHTPGPWSIGRICEGSGWVDIVKLEDGIKSLPFAACKHFDQEANARLIAAAPDLLSALQALVEFDGYQTEYDGQMLTVCPSCGEQDGKHSKGCDFENARAAIAKATGPAP